MATELTDEAEDLRQAEAGAAPRWFGREKWLESALLDCAVHAETGILDRHGDELAWQGIGVVLQQDSIEACPTGLQGNRPALRHRMPCIGHQIEQSSF